MCPTNRTSDVIAARILLDKLAVTLVALSDQSFGQFVFDKFPTTVVGLLQLTTFEWDVALTLTFPGISVISCSVDRRPRSEAKKKKNIRELSHKE